ncbi:MAG: FAD:protein FMN transferase [Bacillota bacterium]|nr:FAD:protein FMN transferase [Bacillota bacterium]
MKRFLSLVLIFALTCTALCGCTNKNEGVALEKFSNVIFDAFDTVITITAYCKDEAEFTQLFDFASSEFERYHKLFDIYNSYDGITNIKDVNDTAANAPVNIDSAIIDLIEFGKLMFDQTGGKVNIAMGSVLEQWHNAKEKANSGYTGQDLLPSIDVLKSANAHCNINDIVIDKNEKTVFFTDSQLKLDVGAIAKGYATEQVMSALVQKGYQHILINAGGNVRTYGLKPDGSSWIIGIQDPEVKGGETYIDTVSIETNSVVTSGVYERNFTYEGKTYHHIIDPDTLLPEDRFLSVSIITQDSAIADALSTAVFNMELEEGQTFIESLNGVEAMWILNDKSQLFSTGFEQYLN